jgi:outer membrane protein assembly factor BamB
VDGEVIYALSSDGNLVCADVKKGAVKWKKNFRKDFDGASGGWAYTESPLVDGDRLICTPGGSKATIVALNKKDGEPVWKAQVKGINSTAGYSSAIVATVGGVRQYVQFLHGGVVGVSAKDGKELWHYKAPANGTANCSTPLFGNDCVFAASSYGVGGGLAKITKDGEKFTAKEEYFVKELRNHHGGMVLVNGYVYGTGDGSLLCVNFKTGKIAWNKRSVGKGSVVYADGHIYLRSEGGPVALVEANPKGFKETGRFDQPERSRQSAWAHPVIAGGKLYLRDWDKLFCYDVKAKK